MRKTYLVLAIVIVGLFSMNSIAQEGTKEKPKRYNSLRLFYQAGKVLQTNDFVEGKNESGEVIESYQALSLEYAVQTDGRKLWQQLYAYPRYGFGWYNAHFFADKELGTPTALYMFFNGPFKRWNKLSFNYEIGFGLTYNWSPYDPIENPFNIAIGSKQTVYIDAGIQLRYMLAKRWDLDFGYSFTHFSNGATKVPNFGLNLTGPRLGISYQFKQERPEFIVQDVPEYNSNWEWYAAFSIGAKQVEYDTLPLKYLDVDYGVFTFSTVILRQTSHKVKFGGGIDVAYDGSINAQLDITNEGLEAVNAPFTDGVNIAVFGAFELAFSDFALMVHPGYYIIRKDIPGQKPAFWQRVGLKYHFWQGMWGAINIRASEFSKADFIEWQLGYRLQWD